MKRSPTEKEIAVLHRLLEKPFPGRDQLALQTRDVVVEEIGDPRVHSLLAIEVQSPFKAITTSWVPVEASADDEDGVRIDFILHVREGQMYTLEVLKADHSPIIRMPDAAKLDVFVRD